MKKHQRDLAEFLRREYGAAAVRLEPGGKHQKLAFSYQGREHRFPVYGSSRDPNAHLSAMRQLRHALGEPPSTKPRVLETVLETMMPEQLNSTATITPFTEPLPSPITTGPGLVPPTGRTWTIRSAAYRNAKADGAMLQFVFPHAVGNEYPNGVRLEQLDVEHWKIVPGGDRSFVFLNANSAMVKQLVHGMLPFRSMDVEAIEADGAILIYLPLVGRMPVETTKFRPSSGKSTAPVTAPITEPPALHTMKDFKTRSAFITYLAIELKISPGAVSSALNQHNWDINAAIADLKTRPPPETKVYTYQGKDFPSKAAVVRLLISLGMDKAHAGFAVQGLDPSDVTGAVQRYCEAFDFDMPGIKAPPPPKAEPERIVEPPPRTDIVPYQLKVPEHLRSDILLLIRLLTAQPELHIALHDPTSGRFMIFTKDA